MPVFSLTRTGKKLSIIELEVLRLKFNSFSEHGFFDLSTLNDINSILEIPRSELDELRSAHCMKYKDMSDECNKEILRILNEIYSEYVTPATNNYSKHIALLPR